MDSQSELYKKIDTFITQHELLPPASRIILGLSGGPDSIFLLHILLRYHQEKRIALYAAHLDHEWRTDSGKDAFFCKEYAESLGIPCEIGKASELPANFKKTGSQEELGRTMRRFFLEMIKKKYQADRIALAHHLQDQEETFFIRLIRGTTLSGLCGMRPQQDSYIRPLLTIQKRDILDHLDHHKIPYVQDPTNFSNQFLRNKIRHSVITALAECDKRFDNNFLRTIESLQKTDDFLEEITQTTYQTLLLPSGIDIKKLLALNEYLQDKIIIFWLIEHDVPFTLTASFLAEIKRFLKQKEAGFHQLHTEWAIKKDSQIAAIVKRLL